MDVRRPTWVTPIHVMSWLIAIGMILQYCVRCAQTLYDKRARLDLHLGTRRASAPADGVQLLLSSSNLGLINRMNAIDSSNSSRLYK
jgi:hypothetical protein